VRSESQRQPWTALLMVWTNNFHKIRKYQALPCAKILWAQWQYLRGRRQYTFVASNPPRTNKCTTVLFKPKQGSDHDSKKTSHRHLSQKRPHTGL